MSVLLAAPLAQAYQGYGYQSAGGQGGSTCRVTTLAASGSGSLASCVTSRSGPRIVVFDVGGTITLGSTLRINAPYLTIDGSSAPAPGITIRPSSSSSSAIVVEDTHDLIIKGVRLQGYGGSDGGDLIGIDGSDGPIYNVVIDHVTFLRADDGALDITDTVRDVTVSWCLFYDNGMTSLIKYGTRERISLHHNVFAQNGERNPQLQGDLTDFDFVNNVVYDWGNGGWGYGLRIRNVTSEGRVSANVVNNLFVADDGDSALGLVYGSDPGGDSEDDGPSGTPAQGTVVTSSNMGDLWVAGNMLPSQNRDHYSTVPGPVRVPLEAQVTTWPASELRTRVVPAVGTAIRTSAESTLLAEIGGGGGGATLSVTKSGAGSGSVTSSPSGISCGSTCSATYASGTGVTLTASPASGSSFAGWSGACTGAGSCQVTMSGSRSVTATFTATSRSLSIGDARLDEGASGTRSATFTVRLSAAAAGTVSVNYATKSGTPTAGPDYVGAATAGSDYVAKSGTLTFAAGETSKTLAVSVKCDAVIEKNEAFTVNLSGAAGATIADGQATGIIVNDDFPRMSINDVTVTEGNTGTRNAVFRVTLSAASPQYVKVSYTTANGTATAGSDYAAKTGNLTFAPGQTSKTITVAVIGDSRVEANERLNVNLSAPIRGTLVDAQGQGTINNDD